MHIPLGLEDSPQGLALRYHQGMAFFPNLVVRQREPEIIDQPDLDEGRLRQALRGLARINLWSGSAGILWPAIRDLATRLGKPLRLLDVATGAGDVPLRLWKKARRAGLTVHIEGCDVSPKAIAFAQERVRAAGAAITFFPWDALSAPAREEYDVIVCSLFLHHLAEEEAVRLLANLAKAARCLLLINDLRRCLAGWLLAYIGTRVLSASPVVHNDGPISVAGAFTPAEALELARRAGLEGATVRKKWPFRFLLEWRAACGVAGCYAASGPENDRAL